MSLLDCGSPLVTIDLGFSDLKDFLSFLVHLSSCVTEILWLFPQQHALAALPKGLAGACKTTRTTTGLECQPSWQKRRGLKVDVEPKGHELHAEVVLRLGGSGHDAPSDSEAKFTQS
jgi:hypothetical protein